METPETISPVPAVEATPAMPKPAAAGTPPWVQERAEPLSVLTATARLERPVEVVHWGVVALTVITAIGVLFSAYGRDRSEPRELLPVVVYAR
ncbi:MAG TPA: hypothetical protein VF481_08550 [Novosphingobium sp.]